jgi:hypothetical protein
MFFDILHTGQAGHSISDLPSHSMTYFEKTQPIRMPEFRGLPKKEEPFYEKLSS